MDFEFAARMLPAMAVIVGVLFGLQLFARASLRNHLTARSDRRLITVLETTYLPNAATLHVVKVADRYLVVARSGGSIAQLSEIPHESIEAWLAAQHTAPVAPATMLAYLKRLRSRSSSPS